MQGMNFTMYVCICNALKDKDLAAAANSDVTGVADVFKRCGGRPRCGKCLPDVAQMIENARNENRTQAIAAE